MDAYFGFIQVLFAAKFLRTELIDKMTFSQDYRQLNLLLGTQQYLI